MQKNVKTLVNYAEIGEAISHDLAAKMVKDFHDAHSEDVQAFLIGKNILEQILAQPGCVGVKFYNAYNEAGVRTLVYVGLDKNGNIIAEYTGVNEEGKLGKVEALVGDRTDASTIVV